MTNKIRFYMSVEEEPMKEIDRIVEEVNEGKETWRRHTNRQAVIRGLIEFSLKHELRFTSGYGKCVTVRVKK